MQSKKSFFRKATAKHYQAFVCRRLRPPLPLSALVPRLVTAPLQSDLAPSRLPLLRFTRTRCVLRFALPSPKAGGRGYATIHILFIKSIFYGFPNLSLVCLRSAPCWRRCASRVPSRRTRRLTFAPSFFFVVRLLRGAQVRLRLGESPLRYRRHRVALINCEISHKMWFFVKKNKKVLKKHTFCGIIGLFRFSVFFVYAFGASLHKKILPLFVISSYLILYK